jgi:hypothetical protein
MALDGGELGDGEFEQEHAAVVGESRAAQHWEPPPDEGIADASERLAQLRIELVVEERGRLEDYRDGCGPAGIDV